MLHSSPPETHIHIILLKLSWWGQYHSGLGCQDVVSGKWLEITWLASDCRQGSWINNCLHFTHECSERFLIQAVAIFFHEAGRTFLVVLIWRSHTPPKWLAAGGLKIHQSMFSFSNLTRISSWSISSMAWSNSFPAPTQFVPLSLLTSLTGPRQAMKCRSAGINEFDSRELATSIWTARLTKHVNRAPYRFTSLRPSWLVPSRLSLLVFGVED